MWEDVAYNVAGRIGDDDSMSRSTGRFNLKKM